MEGETLTHTFLLFSFILLLLPQFNFPHSFFFFVPHFAPFYQQQLHHCHVSLKYYCGFLQKPAIRSSQRGGRLVLLVTILTAKSTVRQDFASSSFPLPFPLLASSHTSFPFWFQSGETFKCDLLAPSECERGGSPCQYDMMTAADVWCSDSRVAESPNSIESERSAIILYCSNSESCRDLYLSPKRRWKLQCELPATLPVNVLLQYRVKYCKEHWYQLLLQSSN